MAGGQGRFSERRRRRHWATAPIRPRRRCCAGEGNDVIHRLSLRCSVLGTWYTYNRVGTALLLLVRVRGCGPGQRGINAAVQLSPV